MSIKWKLLWSYIFLIIFSTTLLGSILGSNSQAALFKEIQAKNEKISNLISFSESKRKIEQTAPVTSSIFLSRYFAQINKGKEGMIISSSGA